MKIRGRVWVYGDNVNTDYIIPGKYMALSCRKAPKRAWK